MLTYQTIIFGASVGAFSSFSLVTRAPLAGPWSNILQDFGLGVGDLNLEPYIQVRRDIRSILGVGFFLGGGRVFEAFSPSVLGITINDVIR